MEYERKKITHDKIEKNIIYDDAILNLFDFPVFYFSKFFTQTRLLKDQVCFNQNLINLMW